MPAWLSALQVHGKGSCLEPFRDLSHELVHQFPIFCLVQGYIWPWGSTIFCIHPGQVAVPVRCTQQGNAFIDELVEVEALIGQEVQGARLQQEVPESSACNHLGMGNSLRAITDPGTQDS